MIEREVLAATDEWIKNLKNLLPSVSSENQEYVQSRIGLLERLQEQAERVQELEKEKERYQSGRNVAVKTKMKMDDLEKQNKRYREALKNIYDLAEYDEYDNVLEQIVSEVEKALEGDDD